MTEAMSRKKKWRAFYEEVERLQHRSAPPAFVQEIVAGLWAVQKLVRTPVPTYGTMYQLLVDPPSASNFEAYYNGWPGDHRGWMHFESKESARDFFKFAERLISYEEYGRIPRRPLSLVKIDLDDHGDFVSP